MWTLIETIEVLSDIEFLNSFIARYDSNVPEVKKVRERLEKIRDILWEKECGWIRVEDRLPPPWEEVIIYDDRAKQQMIASYTTKGLWRDSEYYFRYVTHWTPKLLPPKK